MRLHAWAIVVLLASSALLLHARGDVDRVPPSQPLDQLAPTIGGWSSTEIPIDQPVLDILGKGIFLNRVYTDPDGRDAPIGLFIGYFPTQRTGQAIHSPQNCLPGAGWTFDLKTTTLLTDANGRQYRVGEYLISDGKARQEVLYWYRSHGRSVANDYLAKLYTLADSIRYNRTDAALVRVITQVRDGESQRDAHDRAVSFAEKMAPLLPAYIPD